MSSKKPFGKFRMFVVASAVAGFGLMTPGCASSDSQDTKTDAQKSCGADMKKDAQKSCGAKTDAQKSCGAKKDGQKSCG